MWRGGGGETEGGGSLRPRGWEQIGAFGKVADERMGSRDSERVEHDRQGGWVDKSKLAKK